jgi:hypothetical protein
MVAIAWLVRPGGQCQRNDLCRRRHERQTVSREEQIQKLGLDPKATTIVTTLTHNYAYGLAVSGDGELQAGQTLSIPKLALNANNADTFQPYDPSRVTGSLDSVLPAPVLAALSAQPLRRAAPP